MINKIAENIYDVGAIDFSLRNFHGYSTEKGSSYNAYIILDEKTVLIDTVKAPFSRELISNIKQVLNGRELDYIISNHVEPDHSGALPEVIKSFPSAKVYTSSPSGLKGLELHYGKNMNFVTVKSGDELSLGKRTLSFIPTPMIHWPDNMVTFLKEDKILFSNDSFGQHLASNKRFDDENEKSEVIYQAKKYYANIVMPYGAQVKKALELVNSLNVKLIAPAHGVILRSYIQDVLDSYKDWSEFKSDKTAVIVYDSMWGSTEKMARKIAETFSSKDFKTEVMDLKCNHISDVVTKILTSQFVVIGSPTLNNNIMPTVGSFLTYLTGLSPKGKKGFAFSSYGWGGQSAGILNELMEKAGVEIVLQPVKIQYVPSEEQLKNLQQSVLDIL